MPQISEQTESFFEAKWEMPRPGPVWAWWLKGARSDGPGLRRWQLWIWWMRQKKQKRRFSSAVLYVRGLVEAPIEVFGGVRRFGKKTLRVYGVSSVAQYFQLLGLRWRFGIRPESYYRYMMFRPERLPHARHFVEHIVELLYVVCRYSRRTEDEQLFLNKEVFRRWCDANDIPTVRNLLEIVEGKVVPASESPLPAMDLFVKPANGIRGFGVSRWRCIPSDGDHRYADGEGRELCPTGFEEFVCQLSIEQARPYLVQPALTNHEALRAYTSGALATVRLMTVRDNGAAAQPLLAVLRMPTGKAVADAFFRGGIAVSINLETGQCDAGIQKNGDYPVDIVEAHPDTGYLIADLMIPHWADCIALACRAHNLIEAPVPVIGWDVAVLDEGPMLIEANHLPCEKLAQMPTGFALGASQFASAVCAPLRAAFLA